MFSAVHPTTDIAKILRHVRFVPQETHAREQECDVASSREPGGLVLSIVAGSPAYCTVDPLG
jgi:hypothetical protein